MFILSQSFAQNKVGFSVAYNYGLLKLPGNPLNNVPDGHNTFISPSVHWNITNSLIASAGGTHMWGPSSGLYGPIMGGYFLELKAFL